MSQFCTHCGAILQGKTRFCISCGKLVGTASGPDRGHGEALEKPRSPEPAVAKKKKRPRRGLLLAALLLSLGGALASGYFYLTVYRPEFVASIKATILGSASPEQTATTAQTPSGSGLTTAQLRAQWAERALNEDRLADAEAELRRAEELEPGSAAFQALRARLNEAKTWFELQPGQSRNGFTLAEDGTLSFSGQPFSPELKIPSGQGQDHHAPSKVFISPLSPSRKYAFLGACGGEISECGYTYLIDLEKRRFSETFVGKYGPPADSLIKWSPADKYALIPYSHAGYTGFYSIDLKTTVSRYVDMPYLEPLENNLTCSEIGVFSAVDVLNTTWHQDATAFTTNVRVGCNVWKGKEQIYKVEVDAATLRGRVVDR